jgi:type II secretory pathway pseudopilin PulG
MAGKRNMLRRGFWLVESAVAIAVVGVGIVAVVGSQQSWHVQAVASGELATGVRLAAEIREMSLLLPANDPVTGNTTWGIEFGELIPMDLDDLDDLDGGTFSDSDGTGPLDATGAVIVGMDGWEQRVAVQCVNPFDVTTVVADGSSEVVRIKVTVFSNNNEITSLSWIAPR